jgi:hypothetical protein
VSVRLQSLETVSFVRESELDVESPTATTIISTTNTDGQDASSSSHVFSISDKIVTKVPQYVWKLQIEYELFAFTGTDPRKDKMILQSRKASQEIITAVKKPPQVDASTVSSQDLNLSWFLASIDPQTMKFRFSIDRERDSCRTPRRNEEVDAALLFFSRMRVWASQVSIYLDHLFAVSLQHQNLDFASFKNTSKLFVPFAPLFLSPTTETAPDNAIVTSSDPALAAVSADVKTSDAIVPVGFINSFLWEQKRSISEQLAFLVQLAPPTGAGSGITTLAEASLALLSQHLMDIGLLFRKSVDYIEKMLLDQLEAAIGKNLTPASFTQYMHFHQMRLFAPSFRPKPFCHAIRRPGHYPEGLISICPSQATEAPILSHVRKLTADEVSPMSISLNAATQLVVHGDTYLHTTVQHKFASSPAERLSLIARARQFSSFILLVGRIASSDQFDPCAAILIQNATFYQVPRSK